MILQVNDISFDQMSNDHAVKVLRDAVQKPGPIKLVVAKCWEPNPKGYFTIPRTEQVTFLIAHVFCSQCAKSDFCIKQVLRLEYATHRRSEIAFPDVCFF